MSNAFANVATVEPEGLTAGDTWIWSRPDLAGDYPVAAYSLAYVLVGPDGIARTIAAAGADYTVTVAAGTSSGYPAGRWRWSAIVTQTADGKKLTVRTGGFTVEAALSAAVAGFVTTSHVERVLAAVEATIEGRASSAEKETRLADGRMVQFVDMAELLVLRDKYRAELRREITDARLNAGGSTGRRLLTRMG